MSRLLTPFRQVLSDPRTREFLLWCLPALLAGLVLRVALTVHLPYAFYHDDTPDFFATPEKLLQKGDFDLHVKKTWLVPTLFTIPFLLRIPALIAIPIFQHVLGLGLVVLVGLLCRLWFRHWKIFIVPLTLLTAVNPFFLWYEHTIMAEPVFIFCTVLLAVAGTLYAMEQTWGRFIFLCVALSLEAGARPEGKLLFGFGLFLLVLLHFRRWREMWPRVAIMFVLAITTHFITKTAQAGLLLYTSVTRLTPSDLKVAPGFDPYIDPIRKDLQERWSRYPSFPKVRDRRAIAGAVERYLAERGAKDEDLSHADVNAFCLKLAVETCRRNFFYLPVLTYHKFRAVATESPAGLFNNAWLFDKQREAFVDSAKRNIRASRQLSGQTWTTEADLHRFIDTQYGEVPWFNQFADQWLSVVNAWHFPDTIYREGRTLVKYPGLPVYFILGTAGLLVVMLRRGHIQPFHIAWGLAMLGFFYVIMLTANVRPRFRFVFEPFWFVYAGLLLETLWLGISRLLPRR